MAGLRLPELHRRGSRSRGQALVEMALVFPMVLLMLILIIDFSRVFYHSLVLSHASREGAWVGTDKLAPNDRICDAARATAPLGLVTCESVSPSTGRASMGGVAITVTTSYQFSPITPGLSTVLTNLGVLVGGQLKLQQSAQMVIL